MKYSTIVCTLILVTGIVMISGSSKPVFQGGCTIECDEIQWVLIDNFVNGSGNGLIYELICAEVINTNSPVGGNPNGVRNNQKRTCKVNQIHCNFIAPTRGLPSAIGGPFGEFENFQCPSVCVAGPSGGI